MRGRGLVCAGEIFSKCFGKTTTAKCITSMVGSQFVEINSKSSGVAECEKIFVEARGELRLRGRKTILFCGEILKISAGCVARPCRVGSDHLDRSYNRETIFKSTECTSVTMSDIYIRQNLQTKTYGKSWIEL